MKNKLVYHEHVRVRLLDYGMLVEFEDGLEEVKGLFGRKKMRPKTNLYRISKIEGQYCPLVTLELVNWNTGEKRIVKVSSQRQVHTFVEEEY